MRPVRAPESHHAMFLQARRALFHAFCSCCVLLSDADPSSAPLLASRSATCPTIRAGMQVFILSYHTGSLGMSTLRHILTSLSWFPIIEPPTELVCMVQDSLQHVAAQPIDLLDITPLLWTQAHDLSRLEATVIEQIGQSLLTRTRQYRLEDLPQLTAVGLVFHMWL